MVQGIFLLLIMSGETAVKPHCKMLSTEDKTFLFLSELEWAVGTGHWVKQEGYLLKVRCIF